MMLDETLQALSDPTRRAILDRLAGGAARVTELAVPFAMSLNAVSKHIRVLERARLVSRHIDGREHRLSLNPGALDEAARWMDAQRSLWAWRLRQLDAALNEPEPEAWTRRSTSASPGASPPAPSAPSTPGWTPPLRAGFSSPRRPGR